MSVAGNANKLAEDSVTPAAAAVTPAPAKDRHGATFAGSAMMGLFVMALAVALYVAADLLIPLAIATLLNLLLSPIVRSLARRGVPSALSAAVIVGGLLALVITTMSLLADPAERWLGELPRGLQQLRVQMAPAQSPLTDFEAVAKGVDELTKIESDGEQPLAVKVESEELSSVILGGLFSFLASAGVIVFLTYFMLASGDTLLRKVTRFGRNVGVRRRIVRVARRIQSDISRYLITVTMINLCLGLVTAALMAVLGVSNPLLWGVVVAVLNFAPYLGAAASTVLLLLAGVTTFDTLAQALVVPGTFLVVTILEGQLVTPAVIGKRLSLSPTTVFLAVVVWGWLWGIPGALIAVPIVASLKVICEYMPRLNPIAELLSE